MRKIIICFITFLLFIPTVWATNVDKSRTTAKTCTQPNLSSFYKKQFNQRAVIYNVLNLTDEQAQQKEQIEKERYSALESKYDQLDQEVFVLRKLNAGNAQEKSVIHQQKVVKNIEKEINNTNKTYDKKINKILNHEQRCKFREIKHLQKRDLNHKLQAKKDPYKDKNMRVFGEK